MKYFILKKNSLDFGRYLTFWGELKDQANPTVESLQNLASLLLLGPGVYKSNKLDYVLDYCGMSRTVMVFKVPDLRGLFI